MGHISSAGVMGFEGFIVVIGIVIVFYDFNFPVINEAKNIVKNASGILGKLKIIFPSNVPKKAVMRLCFEIIF